MCPRTKFTNTYKNTKISSNQKGKIHNVSLLIITRHSKIQGSMTKKEKSNHENRPRIDIDVTISKGIKALATVYRIFKWLGRDMEDVKKYLNQIFRYEN